MKVDIYSQNFIGQFASVSKPNTTPEAGWGAAPGSGLCRGTVQSSNILSKVLAVLLQDTDLTLQCDGK